MNKHILTFSQIINESIGVGSVLLIKGKQSSNGRYLYATIIKGSVEIKPGIRMVFIGDEIYRVINNDGRFFGRKISYGSEEGLKGIFNMQNPGKPSIVLNHNKTPFHWITLNFTDIGSALREIGSRLFSHELILESDIAASGIEYSKDNEIPVDVNNTEKIIKSEDNYDEVDMRKKLHDTICLEILKAISGKESRVSPKISGLEDAGWVDDLDEYDENFDSSWAINMEIYLDPNKFREYEKELADLELGGDFMDMLEVQNNIDISIMFSSQVSTTRVHERGTYYDPNYYETAIEDVYTSIVSITIHDIYGNDDISTKSDEIKKIASTLEARYSKDDMTPDYIIDDIEHNVIKSNGSYANLSAKDKASFSLKEVKLKRDADIADSKGALNPYVSAERIKRKDIEPRLLKLAKKISDYWKNELSLDEISNINLFNLQKTKIELDYYNEVMRINPLPPYITHSTRMRDDSELRLQQEIDLTRAGRRQQNDKGTES